MNSKRRVTVHVLIATALCSGSTFLSPVAVSVDTAIEGVGNAAHPVFPKLQNSVRRLQFSGYDWLVKSSVERVGPGPNYFSDDAGNVNVDGSGRLHLKISQQGGSWRCAEIISRRSFGYGTYRFYVDTPPESLDPQVVLGMFTWSDDPAYAHREIDIEISQWGRADNANAQFVVQPYTRPQNLVRFQIPPRLSGSTHIFSWQPDSVAFQTVGHLSEALATPSIIEQRVFTQEIPKPGNENARINLWLWAGKKPSRDKEVEIIISKFEFIASNQ